ncbi:hypothetical protein B0I72DRAFT_140409 [Yarrowia lipolytica]|uniref:Secreted protein n=1 Tax=Yarrowia lipolytica TaxID=4952 RepID=A0A371C5J7_YARLL|nr:hypothetical protein B0I71DRAFT_132303 [Yarrowia lipolytica]RDW31106.1 hypothetical protein B0I72DRAFT_140409 [Yarrowia lipolytica]RDW39378.1 hypothetical protein B0I73DRAFT_132161 [Yarrowia lipolytica]RDW44428.1 hypothetical protein B0I74DRAFT_140454 [Yarrowia lipolytica]RDW51395.1 hypothetical protein B0I75DRAFT_139962 [Yarrowia lipolytica]
MSYCLLYSLFVLSVHLRAASEIITVIRLSYILVLELVQCKYCTSSKVDIPGVMDDSAMSSSTICQHRPSWTIKTRQF